MPALRCGVRVRTSQPGTPPVARRRRPTRRAGVGAPAGAHRAGSSLGLTARLVNATDLLVFQVLLRERAAITDLVATVLGPLEQARGGAQPLVDTLTTFFASGGIVAAAARRLYLSVRAVTYRLDRINQLTDHDIAEPTQRFTLEAAVRGAWLLDWPHRPLDLAN